MNIENFKMNNLKEIREKKNITQLKLGVEVDLTQEIISQYEIGQSKPNLENLIKLADYFHCSTDYLLNRTDNPLMNKSASKQDAELNEFIMKYQMLNREEQKHLQSYIDFLVSKKNKDEV